MAQVVLEYGSRPRLLGRRRVRVAGLVLVMMMGVGAAAVVGQRVWRAQEARKAAAARAETERMKKAKLALFEAAEAGDEAGVRRALAEGVGVDVVDDRPFCEAHADRALEWAIFNKHRECVAVLLEAGANPNRVSGTWSKFSLLGLAAMQCDKEIVRSLLAHGANPNDRPAEGLSALFMACELGDEPTARILLDAGADPDSTNGAGMPTIHMAATCWPPRIVKVLLEHGADPNGCDEHGRTALDVCFGSEEVKEMLMRAGGRHGDGYDWPRD